MEAFVLAKPDPSGKLLTDENLDQRSKITEESTETGTPVEEENEHAEQSDTDAPVEQHTNDHTERSDVSHPKPDTKAAPSKCIKCGRKWARKGCTQQSCLTCCDDTQCAMHNELREKERWKEQVLAGMTPTQLKAKAIRERAIPKGRFRETDFCYLGDTLVLWELKQYLANPAWRDDAVRKSKKRKTRRLNNEVGNAKMISSSKPRNRRKRFQQKMEELYQKSLMET